jgi:hypothetical protein
MVAELVGWIAMALMPGARIVRSFLVQEAPLYSQALLPLVPANTWLEDSAFRERMR